MYNYKGLYCETEDWENNIYMGQAVISEIQLATAKNVLIEKIRESIVSGVFRPGERLNETQLATRFGVSRIPVREALLQLQEQGLVMNHPRRGMFVIQLIDEDAQKICSLRIVLESEALKLCQAHLTDAYHKRLSDLVERMDEWKGNQDFEAAALDLAFHRTIWECAGNQYLERALNGLLTILFAHQALAYTSGGDVHWPLNHHRALLDVVTGKSEVSAETAMVRHLRVRYTNPERFSSLAYRQPVQN